MNETPLGNKIEKAKADRGSFDKKKAQDVCISDFAPSPGVNTNNIGEGMRQRSTP